jgi:hypothetical protein
MAGKIIADTLEHSTAGSLTTDYVVNGSAKCWVNYTTVTTTSDLDSSNVSSLTDNGTGDTTTTYVNAMNADNYSSVGLCGEQLTTAATRIIHIGTKTASAIRVHTTTTSAIDDMPENNVVVHGDLA